MKSLVFLFFCVTAFGELTRLPEEFTLTERFLSIPGSFDIETDAEPFAVAHKKLFSLTASYDLEDLSGNQIASSKARFFAWTTIADVIDPEGRKIGTLEEEYFKILPWALYHVFNAENQEIAIAKMNVWGTKFELYHPDRPDEIYATISRPFIRFFYDRWTVRIYNYRIFEQGIIDPRLLVLLAVYQTDKDNRDRLRNEIFNLLELQQEDVSN